MALLPPAGASASPEPPAISPSGGAVRAPARVVVSQPNPLASVLYTLDLGGLTRVVASEKFPVPGRDRAYIRLRCRLR